MDRKKILFFFFLILGIFMLTACGEKKNNEDEPNDYDMKFYEISSYLDKDNDWTYIFSITYNNSGTIEQYHFNGYNMKYDKMDGFYIPVIDETTGKEVSRLAPSMITLVNDQKHQEEFTRINEYFNSRKFNSKIELNDLTELETSYFKKEDLIILFNDAILQNYKREFGNFSRTTNFLVSREIDGKTWQIVTLGTYGHIDRVRIDMIFSDGQYLTDKVEKNNASESEKSIYKDIKIMEERLLLNQKLDFDNISHISDKEKMEIKRLINEVEE